VSTLAVRGWGMVAPGGAGDVSGLYEDDLPAPTGHALVDFDIRARLGRKGTSALDRGTALALLAVGAAIDDGGLRLVDEDRRRIGVVLGTTVGSLRSTSDYSRETLVEDPPYLVNPVLFPNTVMNRAAGQSAIWYGLKGVNATLAGGPLALLHVLRFAGNTLRRGHADVVLAGAVEEFTPHAAWLAAHTNPGAPAGEGAFVAVLRRADDCAAPDAEILSVATGYAPGRPADEGAAALARCLSRALAQAGVMPADISLAVCGERADGVADQALDAALGSPGARRLHGPELFGECSAAGGALALAAVLREHRDDPRRDGQLAVLVARTRDGGVGAAVVRGWSRAGADRG